jgi:hypothetical protein
LGRGGGVRGGEDEGEKTKHAHAMTEAVYSEEAVEKFVRSKRSDLAKRVQKKLETFMTILSMSMHHLKGLLTILILQVQ